MTIVMCKALAGARRVIREEVQLGPGPACETLEFGTGRARTLLSGRVQDPALAPRYGGRGDVCLGHLVDALTVAEPTTLKLLRDGLLESLHEEFALIDLLGGADADAPRRAVWRERVPSVSYAGSTVERLTDRPEREACPAFLASGVSGRDYLGWFLAGSEGDDPSLGTDDLEAVAVPALAHRVAPRPDLWVQRVQAEDAMRECMSCVPAPSTGATR